MPFGQIVDLDFLPLNVMNICPTSLDVALRHFRISDHLGEHSTQ